jgi:ZIP family zinc transporter
MLEAFAWGALAASSLLLGAVLALLWSIPTRVIGWVLAFGSGVLISAVAFDLVEEAADTTSASAVIVGGLFAGCAAFSLGNLALSRRGGGSRKRATGDAEEDGSALAIVLGTVLDGIPESAVIGVTLLAGGEIGLAYLVAVFVSNLPEALSSTAGLRSNGWRAGRVLLLWAGVVGVSALSSALGYGLLGDASAAVRGAVLTFAAGAILTMLADTMVPEAYRLGGKAAGVLTTLGFSVAFALHQWA